VPLLPNQRHEIFCQEIAKGETLTKAYETAGYRPSRKNASRLRANEVINARVLELQAACAKSAAITISSICAELDEANAVAKSKGQAAAMVSASALRAKLAGLLTDRVEVTTIDQQFDQTESYEDIAKAIVQTSITEGRQLSEADQKEFHGLLMGWMNAIGEFYSSHTIKHPWVIEGTSPADIRDKEINGPYRQRRLISGGGH
jgi:hypothetical protein